MQVGVANAAELDGDLDVVGAGLSPLNQVRRERLVRGWGGVSFNLQGDSPKTQNPAPGVTMLQGAGLD